MMLSAREISFRVNNRLISAPDFIEETVRFVKENDKSIHSFLSIDEDAANKAALIKPDKNLTLAGVPFAIKDNIAVKDLPCTCGSLILKNYISPFSATAVNLLKDAGAVVIGKTNLDEFAMGSSCEYSAFGNTLNPLLPGCVPGGSSGGSAAAVSAGFVPFALGSDSGGSVRQPAAFCQISALKPSWGLVSRYGLVPLANSLDCIGIMAKDIEDIAIVFNLINKYDPLDSTSIKFRTQSEYLPQKFVYPQNIDNILSADISSRWKCFIESCKNKNLDIIGADIPDIDHILSAYMIINMAETATNLSRFDGIRYGCNSRESLWFYEQIVSNRTSGFGDEVKRRLILGNYILAADHFTKYYEKALAFKSALESKMESLLQERVMIMPAAPSLPFNFGEMNTMNMYHADILTAPASLSGLPALTMPLLKGKSNYIAGLQIIGKKFSENSLFNIGQTLLDLNIVE